MHRFFATLTLLALSFAIEAEAEDQYLPPVLAGMLNEDGFISIDGIGDGFLYRISIDNFFVFALQHPGYALEVSINGLASDNDSWLTRRVVVALRSMESVSQNKDQWVGPHHDILNEVKYPLYYRVRGIFNGDDGYEIHMDIVDIDLIRRFVSYICVPSVNNNGESSFFPTIGEGKSQIQDGSVDIEPIGRGKISVSVEVKSWGEIKGDAHAR